MRLLATALLALAFPATAQEPQIPMEVIQAAMEVVCARSPAADCSVIPSPLIAVAPLLWNNNFLGVFSADTPTVIWLDYSVAYGLLDPTHVDIEAFGILMHEAVHYVDFHSTGLDHYNVLSVCASEGRAWWVHNDWMLNHGAPELTRWDWRDGYPHCRVTGQF